MIELRWMVEKWEEYGDSTMSPSIRTEKPVLQYRFVVGQIIADSGTIDNWSEWQDVPTEIINT